MKLSFGNKSFFVPFKDIIWRDQIAHFIIGGLLAYITMYFTGSFVLAVLLSMTISFVREMIQHPWEIGQGSRTDLFVWLLGSITGSVTGVIL